MSRHHRDKPKVIYRLNIPSPYAAERFNVITRRGNIELEAWFDAERQPDRSWDVRPGDWEFPARYVQPGALSTARQLFSAAPDVLFTMYNTLSFATGMMAARAAGARTVLRVLKTFETWQRRNLANELSKNLVFRFADAIHTTGPDGEAYARQYGAKRIFAFPEPIDVERFRQGAAAAREDTSRRDIRGLHGCVFLYVGRLWRAKGLDYLIDAFKQLVEEGVDASLLLVGDGVDESYYRHRATEVGNIYFSGFVQQKELPSYYGLADAFVFPTLGDPYGHVVHEAMAASVPVIATESAGDIRGRVIDGRSGFIVPPANSEVLLERMRLLALDAATRRDMADVAFSIVQTRTNDWWAAEFEEVVHKLIGNSITSAETPSLLGSASFNPTRGRES